ncbi:hypothetical protein [Xanthomonas melonis]|nr:hypothetical protein [Xanthomonas melonis]MCC4600869.1 hypothetical protein [Xanthomonas melonis]
MAVVDIVIPGRATAPPVMEAAGDVQDVGSLALEEAHCPHPPFGHLLPLAGEGDPPVESTPPFGHLPALAGEGDLPVESTPPFGHLLALAGEGDLPVESPGATSLAGPETALQTQAPCSNMIPSRLTRPRWPALADTAASANAQLGALLLQRYSASLRGSQR